MFGEELGNARLDQRAMAGIGNVYTSEVAFLEGLDPWAPVAAFGDAPASLLLGDPVVDVVDRLVAVTGGSSRAGFA